jgi:hypothetical protein
LKTSVFIFFCCWSQPIVRLIHTVLLLLLLSQPELPQGEGGSAVLLLPQSMRNLSNTHTAAAAAAAAGTELPQSEGGWRGPQLVAAELLQRH